MRITLAGTRTHSGEPPRSTAYYYADLERLKKHQDGVHVDKDPPNPDELSEYVESNEVVNDGAVREVPPLRDRRPWSPEYQTPEARKPEETYSTAGTFPMPEPKEKEPLLAELEVVGRVPLSQLDSPGVRRSRSWYLCCPNVADEEMSRESSWRYSSLRPVTAPPAPGQNGISPMLASVSSGREDVTGLKAERDALARALAAERARAATVARAHDARLAELHGVIAELVRRRAADKHQAAIPEEEVSDECESTTQPAGELDNDADQSRTEQDDTCSMLSPEELTTPQEPRPLPDDTATTTHELNHHPAIEDPVEEVSSVPADADSSLHLSERDSELCLSTARCCQYARGWPEEDDAEPRVVPASPGRCEARQAKVASRVRLRRAADDDDVTAELRAAIDSVADDDDECVWRARWLAGAAEAAGLRLSGLRAADTARRLQAACGELEAAAVAVCAALAAADRALEAYDVLLALAETTHHHEQRSAAESVALQLLRRLDDEKQSACIGEPLLSPGPWLQHTLRSTGSGSGPGPRWGPRHEARLRAHAARLKAETVSLRAHAHQPRLFSYHDIDEDELPKDTGTFSMAKMEAVVMMQEILAERVSRASNHSRHTHRSQHSHDEHNDHKKSSSRRRRTRNHAETDL